LWEIPTTESPLPLDLLSDHAPSRREPVNAAALGKESVIACAQRGQGGNMELAWGKAKEKGGRLGGERAKK